MSGVKKKKKKKDVGCDLGSDLTMCARVREPMYRRCYTLGSIRIGATLVVSSYMYMW